MKTRVWPEHGYVALRSQEGTDYWKGEGYSAFLSFDRNGIHSHRDKFGLMVYGRQAHLAIDPEAVASAPHAFSARVQKELNRETVCHNTLMVDGKNHGWLKENLALSDFTEAADCKMATVSDLQQRVYPGVKLRRTVAVTPDYVLDVFQAESETNHTYDYLFHTYDDHGKFEIAGDFQPIGSWRQASLELAEECASGRDGLRVVGHDASRRFDFAAVPGSGGGDAGDYLRLSPERHLSRAAHPHADGAADRSIGHFCRRAPGRTRAPARHRHFSGAGTGRISAG